jgi:uncharacterized protein (DUF924 family)
MKWQTIIKFWFKQCSPQQWFKKDAKFDAALRRRFLKTYQAVAKGEMAAWRTTPRGRLAEIIVLDQFSRNMFRGKPESFACDAMALVLAQEAISHGDDKKLGKFERHVLYMPFMHSESKKIQQKSMKLFASLGDKGTDPFAKAHADIIKRFGRFPHRNAILDRKSTAAEKKFMLTHKGF